jgi:hypothetical protein
MLLPCISFGRNFSLGTVDNFLLVTNNRLKQTDFDGNYNCFKPLALEPCVESSIHNLFGKIVFYSQTYSSPVLLFGNIDGIYILQINLETKTIMENFVISNQ